MVLEKGEMMNRLLSLPIKVFIVFCASVTLAQEPLSMALRNQYSGKCLAVSRASAAHGARLVHKECGTREPDTIWEFAVTNGGYHIKNKNSGKCLGVERQSKSDGALVTQVDGCGRRRDTSWQIETLRPGVPLVIKNQNSQKCLALVTGDQIKQYGCGGSPEHVAKTTWQLVEPVLAAPDVTPVTRQTPSELTVLTYNTHLFEDTIMETAAGARRIKPLKALATKVGLKLPDEYHEDTMRRHRIRDRIRNSGADIVALQEVWKYERQGDLIRELRDTYPHAARFDSACGVTLGNGLLLLSKWPLSNTKFKRFPTYSPTAMPSDDDAWANKGVLVATALVGDRKVRLGVSHALTGEDDGQVGLSGRYVAITPFTLRGRPYVLALHTGAGAHIFRIGDDAVPGDVGSRPACCRSDVQLLKYGTPMSPNYVAITSFHLKGHPYIFGLHKNVGANIWRVNDDPSTGLTLVKKGAKMAAGYVAVTSFELNGHPYIFGLHRDVGANIWRVNDDPSSGLTLVKKGAKMATGYVAVTSFELNGHPYIFGLHRDVGANIWRINDDPATGFMLVKKGAKMSPRYVALTSFQQGGHPYIFGLHPDVGANVWRINDDPATGFTLVKKGGSWYPHAFVRSFEMKGRPYLFALSHATDPCVRFSAGASVTRINDDPGQGWVKCAHLEDMRIIAEETLTADGSPAIMMGDLNVDENYPLMDEIFHLAGARDVFAKLANAETCDNVTNKLLRTFQQRNRRNPPAPSKKRLDYVYVGEGRSGFRLVPIDARVIRDWKYDDGAVPDMDLSDHYPVLVKFRIEEAGTK